MFGEEHFKKYYRLNNCECFSSMSKCERARGLRFNVTVAVTVETTGHDLDALGIVSHCYAAIQEGGRYQKQKVLLNNLEIIFLTTSFSLVGVVDWVPDLLPTLKA